MSKAATILALTLGIGGSLWAEPAEVASRPASRPTTRGASAADETQLARLIEQMGSPTYRLRQQAFDELQALGPGIVPLLVKYKDHSDPEIQQRVAGIIDGYKWMTRGAVVLWLDKDSQAVRLDFRPGDVLVKINDVPMTGHRDMGNVPSDSERTYYLWRAGEILEKQVAPGAVGIHVSNWDIAKGGNDHARGISALAEKKYEEAFARLLAARKVGMDDLWTLEALVGLAEYSLRHKQALELAAAVRTARPGLDDFEWSQVTDDRRVLPFSGVQTPWLLECMKERNPSARARQEFEAYFATDGANLPLARTIAAQPLPDAAAGTAYDRAYIAYSRMLVACHDRKWEEALKVYGWTRQSGDEDTAPHHLAIKAALALGDVETACQIAGRILNQYQPVDGDSPGHNFHTDSVFMPAIAAAVAAGRDDLARGLLARLTKVSPDDLDYLLGQANRAAWVHLPSVAVVSPYLRAIPLDSGVHDYFNCAVLEQAAYAPALAAPDWKGVFDRYPRGPTHEKYFHWLNALALMRLGQYEPARQAVLRYGDKNWAGVEALQKAAKFLGDNAERLEKDYAVLKGVYQVYDGKEKGSLWVVRWDGRTFYIDPGVAPHEYPGLAAGQPHVGISGDAIKAYPAGTIYIRRCQIYLFDEQARRWLPTYAAPCRLGEHDDWWNDQTAPVVLKYVLEHYPVAGTGRELLRRLNVLKGWRLYEFNGDLTLAVNLDALKLADLSAEIGRLARKGSPAAVYRVPLAERYVAPLIPSDCGLWRMNEEGQVSRVDLGLKDPNVMVRVLSWPVREGKLYIGVAPQQGGQVIELDRDTGKCGLTEGYCGLGPDDAFVWRTQDTFGKRLVDCEYAIQAIRDKRLAATQPSR